jgi:endonuclease G
VWKAAPLLEDRETLEPDDYTDANAVLHTDRRHQVPLASFTGTPFWRDTNYLSNITPQKSDLNQGAWATLEGRVRDFARQPGVVGVYVMTGPLYERPMPELPRADEAHMVPSAYWKIIALPDGATAKVTAFYFDQDTPRVPTTAST